MKTIENLKIEFSNFSIKNDYIQNKDEVLDFLEISIDDAKGAKKDFVKELKQNNIDRLLSKVKNFFFFVFQDEIDYYSKDISIIVEEMEFIDRYIAYLQELFNSVTDENFKEIERLADFLITYYDMCMDYLDYKRDVLDFAQRGFCMTNSKYEDYREAIYCFMEYQLALHKNNVNSQQKVLK